MQAGSKSYECRECTGSEMKQLVSSSSTRRHEVAIVLDNPCDLYEGCHDVVYMELPRANRELQVDWTLMLISIPIHIIFEDYYLRDL
jgi:hypothetical protein